MTSGLEAGSLLTSSIRLVRPLGAGAMGSVWVADHLTLATQVVVKFIGNDAASNPDLVARFTREAAAAAQVKSPHVVQMLDHGVTPHNVPYIVMELLEGCELGKYMTERGILSPEEVCAIIAQISKALRRAHERRIVHRDIKPQNIFMCDVGGGELFIKVLDFGIAKKLEGDVTESGTRTGAMIGTPYYMSPEQLVGAKDIDFRSDLWSLAVVAFQALTGRVPFHAENMASLVIAIHAGTIPAPSQMNPALSPAIDAWFARACMRDPNARFQSAQEMADALQVAVQTRASAPNVPLSFGGPPRLGAPSSVPNTPASLGGPPAPMQSGSNPSVQAGSMPRASASLAGFGATTGGTGAGQAQRQNNQKLLAIVAGVFTVVVIGCLLTVNWYWKRHLTAQATATKTTAPAVRPETAPTDAPAQPPPEVPAASPAAPDLPPSAATVAAAPLARPASPAPQPVPLPAPSTRASANVLPAPSLPASSTAAKPRPSATPTKKTNDFDRQ
jgi:eukaryotic-like serine/threonine-protein kinase